MDFGGIEIGQFYRPKEHPTVLWLVCGIDGETGAAFPIAMRRSDADNQEHVGHYSVTWVLKEMERVTTVPAAATESPLERIAACLERIDQRLERAPDEVVRAVDHYRRNILGR